MLTHVYAILNGRTKSVSVGDIEKLRYRPHLFCRLCGEDVSFVEASECRCSFFRHTPNPGKTCLEKSDGTWYGTVPVRQKTQRFDFFVRLDPQRLHEINPSVAVEIAIPPIGDSERKELVGTKVVVRTNHRTLATYNADRLFDGGRSYIQIGCCFADRYDLSIEKEGRAFYSRFNNTSVDGFDECGMLFSMETGRRIPFRAEVYVGVPYVWVGKRENAPWTISDVEASCVAQCTNGWCTYRVKASRLSDYAIARFIKFGAALCERGDVVYPLWPCFVRKGDLVCLAPNECQFYGVKADAPARGIFTDVGDEGKFCSVSVSDLFCPTPFLYSPYGEDGVVARDVEIWKETFHGEAINPFVEIWDPDCCDGDKHVPFGVLDKLPCRRRLNIKTRCEGYVDVCSNGGWRQRYALKAQDMISVDVRKGMSLAFYQGLDLVGEVVFKKTNPQKTCEEALSKIEKRWLSCMDAPLDIDGCVPHRLLSRIDGGTELHKRLLYGGFVNSVSHRIIAVIRKRLNKKG